MRDSFSFKENEDRILEKISDRLHEDGVSDPDGFELVNGFFAPSIQREITDFMSIDGPAYSVVAVVAKSTGRIYQYSMKHLFPDVEIL